MMDSIPAHAERVKATGYTIIEDLLPRSLVECWRDAFDPILDAHRARQPENRGSNRYQMYLPFEPPFSDPRLYENDLVLEVVERLLGPDAACVYFASDTPLPGSSYQKVHSDTRRLFPEESHSLPAYGLVLNVPLVDITEENGPMQVWPGGTHLWPGGGEIESLAQHVPSIRLTMRAGSVLLRDLRMWHRGTPNRSSRSRPNLALVYTRSWYRFEQREPVMNRSAFELLSERARRLFRFAEIL